MNNRRNIYSVRVDDPALVKEFQHTCREHHLNQIQLTKKMMKGVIKKYKLDKKPEAR